MEKPKSFVKKPVMISGGGMAVIDEWKSNEHAFSKDEDDLKCCDNPDWIIRHTYGFFMHIQCVNCFKDLPTWIPNNDFPEEFHDKLCARTQRFYFGTS